MKKQRSIKSLLGCYENTIKKVKKLRFMNVEGRDVYNISAPFKIRRTRYIVGRVELREREMGTKSVFFKKTGRQRKWRPVPLAPIFNLQDPFLSKIKEGIIFGGVEVEEKSEKGKIRFRTLFYRGKDLDSLNYFGNGPWGMKDIRFVELEDGRIGIFTRPRGGKAGRGKIGFRIVKYLKDIKPKTLSRARIIRNMFAKGEWGGVNEVHILKGGCLGVLGHIARFGECKKKYYYPITFKFNPGKKRFSGMKILVSRKDLPEGITKRDDLHHVIFPGGIRRGKKNRAVLYAGVSDAESYKITIKDPFTEYEG
jgi:hypothetical protein